MQPQALPHDQRLMKQKHKLKILSAAEVNNRLKLVKRIVQDIRAVHRNRKSQERRFSFFRKCLKQVRSREVEETVNTIREDLGHLDHHLEEFRHEITNLGGILKDSERGWIDFFSERDNRLIFLCWRPGEQEVLYWHEIDKDHNDDDLIRYPLDRERRSSGSF